ncbi:MAG: hypothetical protein AAF654_14385 [Myxococcota bacterium]
MKVAVVLFLGLTVACGNDTTFADGYETLSGSVADPVEPVEDASPSAEEVEEPPAEEPEPEPAAPPMPTCEETGTCDVCPAQADHALTEFEFVNLPQLERSGVFRAEWLMRVDNAAGNAFVAASSGPMDFFDDGSAFVRFAPEGVFNARDGAGFAADTSMSFTAGQWYHARVDVAPQARSYDVFIRPCDGGPAVQLIDDAEFRADRPDVMSLDTISLWTEGLSTLEVAAIEWN